MKLKRVILSIIVILVIAYALAQYSLYRLFNPPPLVVQNAGSILPEVASKFGAEMWRFPSKASEVYAYSANRLKGDAFLRFHLSDDQQYGKFKEDMLSNTRNSQTEHPKISTRDIKHIESWWGLDSEGTVYRVSYWFFGFDDDNQLVYLIRRID